MRKWNKPEIGCIEISSTEYGYPDCYGDGNFMGIPTHGPKKPGRDDQPPQIDPPATEPDRGDIDRLS